jgi:hypothetical protein
VGTSPLFLIGRDYLRGSARQGDIGYRIGKPPPSATRPPLRTCVFNDLGARPGRIWTLPPNCYPRPVESRPIDRRLCVAVVGCQHVGVDRRPVPARNFPAGIARLRRFGDAASVRLQGRPDSFSVSDHQQQKPG